jgi:hypothetical protein
MMKKYKHKTLKNWTAIWSEDSLLYKIFYKSHENASLSNELIENSNDWELIEEEPVIPPGIIRFKWTDGTIVTYSKSFLNYNNWVKAHLNTDNSIYTIKQDGVIWDVGDKLGEDETILEFQWDENRQDWKVGYRKDHIYGHTDSSFCGGYLKILIKNMRKPVCQLPNENGKIVNMFEGDKYWFVTNDNWKIEKATISTLKYIVYPKDLCYATETAAEKYVYENKPVIPLALAEKLWNYVPNRYADVKQEFKKFIESLKSRL